jgi:hypothetical protein
MLTVDEGAIFAIGIFGFLFIYVLLSLLIAGVDIFRKYFKIK